MSKENKEQNELREKITNIRNDCSLSQTDKNSMIQSLMNQNTRKVENKKCSHYPNKKCSNFSFKCCDNISNCVRCHNEEFDHNALLKSIKCDNCNLVQDPSHKCINNYCDISFSKNYCELCNLWTDVDIFHCNKCGLCRVGDEDSVFHCDKCDACFLISLKDNHKCVNISFRDQQCAYCLESAHSSQKSTVSLRCGHLVHNECLNSAVKSNEYRCPNCRKSIYMIDWSFLKYMIESQPMPEPDISSGDNVKCTIFGNKLVYIEEVINNNLYKGYFVEWSDLSGLKKIGFFNRDSLKKDLKKIEIYCNDCETNSIVEFHYLCHECITCGSFNTV